MHQSPHCLGGPLMNFRPADARTELRDLLRALCEGQLDQPGRTRIEQLVRGRPEAIAYYLEYCWLHGELRWQTSPAATDGGVPTLGKIETPPVLSLLGFLNVNWQSINTSSRTLALALGGLLVGYFVVLFALIPLARWAASSRLPPPVVASCVPAQPTNVGELIDHGDTRWAKVKSPSEGNVAHVGEQCELTAGRATIRLARGTCLVIEGPARWRLESADRLHFDAGRLVAQVPSAAVGFAVVTPGAEVIDLGTEFGVEVRQDGGTEVHVVRGTVAVRQTTGGAAPNRIIRLGAGQAVRVSAAAGTSSVTFDRARFDKALELAAQAGRAGDGPGSLSKIWLGNLFDDHPHVPLADAMRTDTFRAEADFNDLGVDRVTYGGAPLQQIAPDLWFDFKSVGWTGAAAHRIANDAWTSVLAEEGVGGRKFGGGIQLEGKPMAMNAPRLGQGIGMHADALLTFHLDDIRAAGKLAGAPLEFICDRAGINDGIFGAATPSVHMLVLVSTATAVETALVDGRPAELADEDGHWSVASPMGEPLRADGRFVKFRVPIPPGAKYLTLVTTGTGDGIHEDHAVWVGARLEIVR